MWKSAAELQETLLGGTRVCTRGLSAHYRVTTGSWMWVAGSLNESA